MARDPEDAMEKGNIFADAVRRIAALAPSVDRRVLGAGAALAVGLSLLAGPSAGLRSLSPVSGQGIPGVVEAATTAHDAAQLARVQGKFSVSYACGLVRVSKKDLAAFGSRQEGGLQAAAAQALDSAAVIPVPQRTLAETAEGVATMARTLAMAGMSSFADAVIGSHRTKEWAAGWRAELSLVGDALAVAAENDRIGHDQELMQEASASLDAAYRDLGCEQPQPRI